ncbi:MAG: glutathione S-transferase family protein [Rhodococcus sp. (in: high G+C Gram-positive bacteria)]|uniref:glutathione S-transferase family protein n=1 Tax=Rhodococcus sp. TaxID=1831 RepID=UPI002ADC7870|nr:glutathione S-transferase family protein [Rhodococcus sp. (in: high G+C Gram-positive bacteria)]
MNFQGAAARASNENADGPVLRQVLRVLRLAVARQVGGRRHHQPPQRAHRHGGEARVRQVGNAHGHVHVFLQQVHQPVDEQRAHLHARLGLQKALHDGRHMLDAEHLRRGDGQQPLGLGLCTAGCLLGLVQVVQDGAAVGQKTLARLRQPHHARAALKQQHTEPRLQRRNRARDGRRRAAQAPPRHGKAARIGHGHKTAQGVEIVHAAHYCGNRNYEKRWLVIHSAVCNSYRRAIFPLTHRRGLTMFPTTPLQLYRMPISGHCHRVELMLSLLGLPYELIDVNLLRGEHQRAEFLALNPLGQVPVLVDAGLVLSDSNAILVYLVQRYAPGSAWLPQDAVGQAQLQRWFSLAAGWLAPGIAAPRFAALCGRPISEAAQATGKRLLNYMESELQGRVWLLGGAEPSLADMAMVSYTSQAHLAGLPLAAYPRIAAWVARLQALPGYVPLLDHLSRASPAPAVAA